MSAKRLVNGRPVPQCSQAGYSLIEMIIALGMAVIVGAGLFAVYNAQQSASRKQRGFIALQTECNLVMDQVKQELLLAGYRGDETTAVKTFAAADAGAVTFEYFDDKAKFNDASPSEPSFDSGVPWDSQYSEHTQVRYVLNGSSLERKIKRWHRATSTYLAEGTQVLADNIQLLAFKYDRGDNTTIALPVSSADLDAIRNIKVDLACQSPKIDPVSGKRLQVALTASVAPRNIGLEANPKDTTAPGVPAELVAWDLGTCGSLRLRWKANTEADLEGYTIFYGLSSGAYSKRARLNRGPGTAGQFEYYTLTDLTATTYAAANATPPTPAEYHIVITAFDKSGNQSGYSAEVANAAQSVTAEPANDAFGSAASDTVINPAAPPDPSPFTATPPPLPAQNSLALAWATPTPAVEGLLGYLLFRDESSADFTPVGTAKGQGNCIADPGELGPAAVSYLDTGLVGCRTYYYKLVAVHCDTTLPVGSRGAKASGAPLDTTPPATPLIVARSGYGRIILSLQNGTDADFDFTRVSFNRGLPGANNFPVLQADGTVTNGTPIPDAFPWPGTRGSGVYDNPGTQPGINFNNEDDGNPANLVAGLDLNSEYYFLAVSYDFCGNPTPPVTEAKTAGVQCSDCEAGLLCQGPPPTPGVIAATGCFGTDGINISWTYPYLSDTDLTGQYRDLAGFHVWRREGDTWGLNVNDPDSWGPGGAVELTGGTPIWFTNFQDAGAVYPAPEDGKTYSYLVQATDCYWEQHHGKAESDWPDPLNSPEDNSTSYFRNNLYLGRPVFESFFGAPYARFEGLAPAGSLVNIVVRSLLYSAEQFPVEAGMRTISIGTEQFACASATPATGPLGLSYFTGCTRGANATLVGPHPVGSTVTPVSSPPPVDAITGVLSSDNAVTRFRHNLVNLRLKNTAAGTLNPQTVTATWQNANARLQLVSLGDGNTTPAQGPYAGDSVSGAPFSLTSASLAAQDEEIPLVLAFRKPDTTVDASTNMRSDLLNVSLAWTNPSMDATACTAALESRTVPPGPIVSRVTLSQPSAGTIAQAIPGNAASPTQPNSIIVPGTVSVDVYAEVLDTSLAGLSSVKLYYKVDNSATPPPVAGSYPEFSGSGYNAIDMEYVAGNEWRTPVDDPIEPNEGSGVWFFVVAVDNNGDFDREPEIDRGAFEYYQQLADVCNNFPKPPSLVGDDTSGYVTLTITDDPNNTDGSPRSDFNGYKVFRSVDGGAWTLWRTLLLGTSSTVDTSADLATRSYAYYATSLDTCVPANVSTASRVFAECIGAPACSVSLTSTADPIYPGNTFNINLSICSKRNGTAGERIWAQSCSLQTADADPISLVEDGDTGTFQIDGGAYSGKTAVSTWLPANYPSPFTNLDLKVEPLGAPPSDTVTVSGFVNLTPLNYPSGPSGWDDTCVTLPTCSATLGVIPDPCLSPVTPTMGTVTASYTANNCNAGNNNVRLTWTPPAAGTYTYYKVYRCNGADCNPTALYADRVTDDADTALAGFQWLDSNPGGKLDASAVKLWYKVTAVNDKCATDIRETPLSSVTKVSDGCAPN